MVGPKPEGFDKLSLEERKAYADKFIEEYVAEVRMEYPLFPSEKDVERIIKIAPVMMDYYTYTFPSTWFWWIVGDLALLLFRGGIIFFVAMTIWIGISFYNSIQVRAYVQARKEAYEAGDWDGEGKYNPYTDFRALIMGEPTEADKRRIAKEEEERLSRETQERYKKAIQGFWQRKLEEGLKEHERKSKGIH